MNSAEFAIPGLMPPKATNFIARYDAPEDGSLKMLLHVGKETDKVYFSIIIPGIEHGTINDPKYYQDKDYPEKIRRYTDRYTEFLHEYDALPDNTIIPRRIIQDWPVPITDLCCVPEAQRKYWVLELPVRTLPIGDTKVQVSINNRVVSYVVSRAAFGAHNFSDDVSMRYAGSVAENQPQN